MKTRKILTLVACAVLLVAITVVGTMAFLNDTSETVTNTFTVGDIKITLDEVEVDTDGVPTGDTRVTKNEYKLIPGNEYTKDPTVHVEKGSEICWVFVTVDNGIASIESDDTDYTSINDQILANGWTALMDGETQVEKEGAKVYYKAAIDATEEDVDLVVFESFKVADDLENDALAAFAENKPEVVIIAYAIQSDNLDTAADAWDALNPAPAEEPAPETH